MPTRLPRVLMIDDNADDLCLLNAGIGRAQVDWSVRSAESLVQVMDLLTPRGSTAESYQPDLIILDLNLGATSGLGVLRWLKAHPKMQNVPVVMLTGCRNESASRLAREYGATLLLDKPPGDCAGVVRHIHEECFAGNR